MNSRRDADVTDVTGEGRDARAAGDTTALMPRREQTVDFYGDGIPVAQTPDGGLYVALRPITDHLGLAFGSQRNRVLRDRVMAPRARTVLMTAADGRQRDLLCLPLDLLPGFLFGVTTGRVRPFKGRYFMQPRPRGQDACQSSRPQWKATARG
jgi:hypothetical protein